MNGFDLDVSRRSSPCGGWANAARLSSIVLMLTLGASAHGGVTAPDYDFDWAVIGDPGNPGYFGPGDIQLARGGRGDVDYRYRMSKLEVTTAQWMEFVNTFSTQSHELRGFAEPSNWGASIDSSYQGPGRRWILNPSNPDAALHPVGGIEWRDAARFCNWLHNEKSSDLNAIVTGAYDTTTFGGNPADGYTDAATHLPGAKFWIPTQSEWIKAVHWDPNKDGPGSGGWWMFPYGSDTEPVTGLPGVGETSAMLNLPNSAEWLIPLGAYPDSKTPWGLLDASGATQEWLEGWFDTQEPYRDRRVKGHPATIISGSADVINRVGGEGGGTQSPFWVGLRIASAIPNPATALCLVFPWIYNLKRRMRHVPRW